MTHSCSPSFGLDVLSCSMGGFNPFHQTKRGVYGFQVLGKAKAMAHCRCVDTSQFFLLLRLAHGPFFV